MAEIELDQVRLDRLREISSISAGNSATSLSVMLGRRVDITVPDIMVESVVRVPAVLEMEENIASVIYFSVMGQVSGSIFFVLPFSESLKLVDILTGKRVGHTGDLNDAGVSALKELGNIAVGSYLSAMAKMLKMSIRFSSPEFALDMIEAVLREVLPGLCLEAEDVVIVKNGFTVERDMHGGHFVFIPEPEALKTIFQALRIEDKARSEAGSE